jgi:hypothetical protein
MINRTDTATAVPIAFAVMALMSTGLGHAADKPIVVATFSVLADLVANVAGDQNSPPLWALTGTRNSMNRHSRIAERWPERGLCS